MKKAKIIRLSILIFTLLIGAFLLTNSFGNIFLSGIGVIMACMTILWFISLAIKDASIIDIFWGIGFVIMAWYYAYVNDLGNWSIRNQVLLALISIWGLRLAIYLAMRNLGKPEDYRYAQWRKDNGAKWWWLSFFRVFALQGFLLWMISATYLPSLAVKGNLEIFDYVGILLWAIGIFFEAVGDAQLASFKKDPTNKGKLMDKGLWRYTRHPNYFGNSMIWWGFFCFSLAHPQGIYYIFCPAIMTLFLLKVSGVAMLERSLKKTKPGYEEYIRKTSAFVPMPPKD